jgi:hypothetical protein
VLKVLYIISFQSDTEIVSRGKGLGLLLKKKEKKKKKNS